METISHNKDTSGATTTSTNMEYPGTVSHTEDTLNNHGTTTNISMESPGIINHNKDTSVNNTGNWMNAIVKMINSTISGTRLRIRKIDKSEL